VVVRRHQSRENAAKWRKSTRRDSTLSSDASPCLSAGISMAAIADGFRFLTGAYFGIPSCGSTDSLDLKAKAVIFTVWIKF
ncbi:hypothetical protein LINPERHAP2_LOCUS27062, partial [Linum perenne]